MHIILRLLWIMDDYGNCWHVHETAARFAIDRCRSNDDPVVRHSRRFPSMLLEWNVKQSLFKCDFTEQVSPKIVRKDQVIRVYEMVGCQNTKCMQNSGILFVISTFCHHSQDSDTRTPSPSECGDPAWEHTNYLWSKNPFATSSSVHHRVLREDSLNFDAKPEHTYLGITKDWGYCDASASTSIDYCICMFVLVPRIDDLYATLGL